MSKNMTSVENSSVFLHMKKYDIKGNSEEIPNVKVNPKSQLSGIKESFEKSGTESKTQNTSYTSKTFIKTFSSNDQKISNTFSSKENNRSSGRKHKLDDSEESREKIKNKLIKFMKNEKECKSNTEIRGSQYHHSDCSVDDNIYQESASGDGLKVKNVRQAKHSPKPQNIKPTVFEESDKLETPPAKCLSKSNSLKITEERSTEVRSGNHSQIDFPGMMVTNTIFQKPLTPLKKTRMLGTEEIQIRAPSKRLRRRVVEALNSAKTQKTITKRIKKSTKKKNRVYGCNCTKTGCIKQYCVCFKNGGFCGAKCKCRDCLNHKKNLAFTNAVKEEIVEKDEMSFVKRFKQIRGKKVLLGEPETQSKIS